MKVLISKPAKTAMQSGWANTKHWRLVFEERASKFVEPLNGWVGQSDTTQEFELWFDTEEEAIAYATKHGLKFEVLKPKKRRIRPKSYASNFLPRPAN